MHTQTPKSNLTTGEKLRAFANQINEGNKLGICSILLVTSLAVTLAVISQDTKPLSKESEPAIRADFQTMKSPQIFIKANRADVDPKNQPTWDWVTRGRPVRDNQIPVNMQIHSIHADEVKPYAIAQVLKSDNTPYLTMIPKDICTDEGWGKIIKMTPRPEFAEKWGYKLPTTLGETNQYGSTAASKAATEDAKKRALQIVPPTMPVERTVTDTKGRVLQGTILSKTDTTISFQRNGETRPIDIKLDTLSANDQAFIVTLVDKENLKPTVLFLVNQDFAETEEVRTWLTNSGFDVKIGVIKAGGYGPASYKMAADVPYVTIDPVEIIDQFDVLWINRFNSYEPKGKEEFSHFSLAGRRNQQQKLVVIPTHSKLDKIDRFLSFEKYYAGSPKLGEEDKAYVKAEKTFIFCSNNAPHNTDEKMREKLLIVIKESLSEK